MKKSQEFPLHKINTEKDYFEGWYYKIQSKDFIFSVIFGISQTSKGKTGFIQTIDTITNKSQYEAFCWEDIEIIEEPFEIHFKNNILCENYLMLDLKNLNLIAEVHNTKYTALKSTGYMPTIMGPFTYFPMECVHSIISLHHECKGYLQTKSDSYTFHGIGYIEKDRGTSFPENYLWYQSNNCCLSNSCFFLSLASIPFSFLSFTGVICVLLLNGEQLRFATYLGCRIKVIETYEKDGKKYANIRLRQFSYFINIRIEQERGCSLIAPKQGSMNVNIHENLNSEASISVYKSGSLLWKGAFKQGASEMVNI